MFNSMISIGSGHSKFLVATPKGLSGSAQFNGSSWLTAANTFNLGTGGFTYEAWCYLSSTSGPQGFFGLGTTSSFITILFNDSGGQWSFNQTSGTTKYGGSEAQGKIGWQHVAVTRNASDQKMRIFIDGVLKFTSASANTSTLSNLQGIITGRAFVPPSTNVFPIVNGGRVTGLRLSNIDRYGTSNFTPTRNEIAHDGNTYFVFNFPQGSNWLSSQNGAITLTNTNVVSVASGL